MRSKKMTKNIVTLLAILITVTIMVTVYRLTDKTNMIPKSATLVINTKLGNYKNG